MVNIGIIQYCMSYRQDRIQCYGAIIVYDAFSFTFHDLLHHFLYLNLIFVLFSFRLLIFLFFILK